MQALVSVLRRTSPAIPDIHLNLPVMLFTFGIAAVVGIIVGLLPLWLLRRGNAQAGVRTQERGFSSSKWSTQFRNALIAVQIAFCVVLLSAAGLLIESFLRMSGMSTGVRTDNVLLFPLDLMTGKYDSPNPACEFLRQRAPRAYRAQP